MNEHTSKQSGKIFSVNISELRGTIKSPVKEITIGEEGVIGDAHYGESEKHVSMISIERIREFSKETREDISPGEFAENLTTQGMDLSSVKLHDRFRIRDAELEVIQIGKPEVYKGDGTGVFRIIGKSVMLHEGLFCKVISGGRVCPGDIIKYYGYGN